MSIIWFIIVGLIAGWITGLIMKGSGYGLLGDIALGIIGALIGSWIFDLLGLSALGIIGSIIMAIIGAVVLVFVVRLIRGVSY